MLTNHKNVDTKIDFNIVNDKEKSFDCNITYDDDNLYIFYIILCLDAVVDGVRVWMEVGLDGCQVWMLYMNYFGADCAVLEHIWCLTIQGQKVWPHGSFILEGKISWWIIWLF